MGSLFVEPFAAIASWGGIAGSQYTVTAVGGPDIPSVLAAASDATYAEIVEADLDFAYRSWNCTAVAGLPDGAIITGIRAVMRTSRQTESHKPGVSALGFETSPGVAIQSYDGG